MLAWEMSPGHDARPAVRLIVADPRWAHSPVPASMTHGDRHVRTAARTSIRRFPPATFAGLLHPDRVRARGRARRHDLHVRRRQGLPARAAAVSRKRGTDAHGEPGSPRRPGQHRDPAAGFPRLSRAAKVVRGPGGLLLRHREPQRRRRRSTGTLRRRLRVRQHFFTARTRRAHGQASAAARQRARRRRRRGDRLQRLDAPLRRRSGHRGPDDTGQRTRRHGRRRHAAGVRVSGQGAGMGASAHRSGEDCSPRRRHDAGSLRPLEGWCDTPTGIRRTQRDRGQPGKGSPGDQPGPQRAGQAIRP